MKASNLVSAHFIAPAILASGASQESTLQAVTTLTVENQLIWFVDFIEQNQVFEDFKGHRLQKWHIKNCLTKHLKSYLLVSCYKGGWHLPMLEPNLIQRWQIPKFTCLLAELTMLYDQSSGRVISPR